LAMDVVMKLPFKVSTTTSNFMIGVTAAASAGYYLNNGQIDPTLAFPVVIGVLVGAWIGTRVLVRMKTLWLRRVFSILLIIASVQMIYSGVTPMLKPEVPANARPAAE